jgi:acyl-ACP thioesterase
VTTTGRLRLDALARYLQDVAEDDVAQREWAPPYEWLVRRCAISAGGFPRRGDTVVLHTFCSGTGPRWAERTTTVAGPAGTLLRATAVWVATDRSTGEPVPLGPEFHRRYGEPAGGRRVSARLSLPGPVPGAACRDWPVRATDFDAAGHVNNAVHWAAAEDVLAGLDWLPAAAELEYRRPILPGALPRLCTSERPGQVMMWLMSDGELLASARLTAAAPG